MVDTLKEKAKVAEAIAEGDLNVDVTVESEADVLGKAFQMMVANLRERAEQAEAIADGDDEETIAEIAATPVIIAPETVEVPMPTGTGSTVRKTWKGEVTDFTALVKAVADGTAPLSFLQPNQSELDAHARMTKAESTIPGYRAYEKASMAGTR